jgi:hypothetical protein
MRSNESTALSRRRRPGRRRASAVGLSAAALVLAAACTSCGTSASSGSASAPLTPRQLLLAAATQAQQITSATETLTIQDSGAARSTITGTIQFRLKPTLLISGNLDATAAGVSTQIQMIFTSTDVYVHEASLTSQVGKPWVEMDLSALSAVRGTSGASFSQLLHSLQSNNFANQALLFSVAKNARIVGTQTIDGVATTEYAGSFTAAAARKAEPATIQQALAPELNALGNGTVYFRGWIDGQHHLRKITEVVTVHGVTTNTTISITAIDQAVHITPPPASQAYFVPGSGPVSGNSLNGDRGAKVVPAPPGFALSQDPGEHSGPMNGAGFNSYMGSGNPAADFYFALGYRVFYDNPDGDIISVTLFQFATQNDAILFGTSWVPGGPVTSKADPVIPGAMDFDSTAVDQDSADHGVFAIKGNVAFAIDDVTSSTAPVPLVETMARQQYAAL